MPVLGGCLYLGGGLTELVVLLLLQHQLKNNVRFWSIALLEAFLVGLILGQVTGAIGEFHGGRKLTPESLTNIDVSVKIKR